MSERHHYSHHGHVVNLSNDRLSDIIEDLERRLRSNDIAYHETPRLTNAEQFNSFRAQLSVEHETLFRTLGLTRVKETGQPKEVVGYQVMLEIMNNQIVMLKTSSTATNKSVNTIRKNVMLDFCTSMLFGVAPDALPETDELKVIKNFGKEIKVMTRVINKKNQAIVDEKSANADIYLFGYYNEQINKAILVGWAKKQDILSAQRGSKLTDKNCYWSNMSYWMPIENLRPMISLIRELGIKKLNPGILLENIPSTTDGDLPTPAVGYDSVDTALVMDDQFLSILGIEDEPKQVKSEPEPKTEDIDF